MCLELFIKMNAKYSIIYCFNGFCITGRSYAARKDNFSDVVWVFDKKNFLTSLQFRWNLDWMKNKCAFENSSKSNFRIICGQISKSFTWINVTVLKNISIWLRYCRHLRVQKSSNNIILSFLSLMTIVFASVGRNFAFFTWKHLYIRPI